MVRRFANQVHKQVSRLMLTRYIEREPKWFQAILDNPPLPLPPRAPPPRTDYDLPPSKQSAVRLTPPKHPKPLNPKALPVAYLEDELRKQFFMDHPFEAYRSKSLVEDGEVEPEHPISGRKWTRLRQRGRNPSPEDAIRYAVNLHEQYGQSLNQAYASAVGQFRALRHERQVASQIALLEAESIGIEFGPSAVEQNFLLEEKALETWKRTHETDMAASTARKRWHMLAEHLGQKSWSNGREYVRLWQEGVRPTYSPALERSVITPAGLVSSPTTAAPGAFGAAPLETKKPGARNLDFLGVVRAR